MTTELLAMEEELRALFAEVPAPAPRAWPPLTAPARRPKAPGGAVQRLVRAPRRTLALVVVIAIAAAAGLSYAHRAQTPSPHLASVLSVSVDPAGIALNCRLPISALSSDRTTGFIVMGNGSPSFNPVHTSAVTYIPALDRWVDVLPQFVAPDGQSYVVQDNTETKTVVRVVDARGSRTVFKMNWSANTRHPSVFAYTSLGILFMDPPPNDPSNLNLKLMDPATAVLRPLAVPGPVMPRARGNGSAGAGYLRSGESIWLTSYDGSSSTAFRYELATGKQTSWWDGRTDGPGYLQVVAADSHGNPVIQVSATDLEHTNPSDRGGIGTRVMLMSAPHQSTVLNSGRVGHPGVAGNLSPETVTDGDNIWLAADDGAIWLYRPAQGMVQVAKVSTSNSGPPGVAISGPCR